MSLGSFIYISPEYTNPPDQNIIKPKFQIFYIPKANCEVYYKEDILV